MKLTHYFVLTLSVILISQVARADYQCNVAEGISLKAFSLAPTEAIFSSKAAVVVKQGSINELYTGSVQSFPTRVGANNQYALTSDQGLQLKLNIKEFLQFLPEKCTRAGCEPRHSVPVIGGSATLDGKDYVFSCTVLE